MNKRQRKKLNKRLGSDTPRNQSKTERGRLGTMVITDKKKKENRERCRGKVNHDN